MAGVLRPKAGRLDSPSNRYAGDWSGCQETYFQPPREDADYDDVPSGESDCIPEGKREVCVDGWRPSECGVEGEEEDEEQRAQMAVVEKDRSVELQSDTEGEAELEVREEEEEEEEKMEEADDQEGRKDLGGNPRGERQSCDHILLPSQEEGQTEEQQQHQHQEEVEEVEDEDEEEHLAKEHTYQAYMKIQDISPVLSNRVNLKDLQESIDILICNLERELNKNKLSVGY